ncbi:MAG TPA: hypothetical protein VGQ92_08820 [Actinoplanes sp.]|jgi:hypothetical protein|nr:hypothetical protein [Actinoplanes sp.]
MDAKTNNRPSRVKHALARWWAGRTRSIDVGDGWAVPPLRDYPVGLPAAGARRAKVPPHRDSKIIV